MKAAIFGQYYKGEAIIYINILLNELAKYNFEVYVEHDYYKLIAPEISSENAYKTFKSFHDLDNSFEVMFTVGGDGTFLRAITYVRDLNIPLLGINVGRLGFLATVQKESIEKAIAHLVNKNYIIIDKTLLDVNTEYKNNELSEINFALNEISVSRRNTTSMITVKTYLDDEYLTSYWTDGLIIATPTGSTGYSLSCGGPVITPTTKSFVITPIAPHNLNARPLIIPDSTVITLKVISREKQSMLSLDSRTTTINCNEKITIKKSNFTIKTIQLSEHTFFKTLRNKLLWGEDRRN
ncbi:MAG: NAD kinase [Flavobacteriales bacterium]|nr:MAG: NAD kinase [Flavobacteriales bacterium]